MKIVTAAWSAPIPDDHIRVGVSRGAPRGRAAGYKMYRKLAPNAWFNSVEPDEYLRRYNAEVLAPLDPATVVQEIAKLAGERVPVLCCFEAAPRIHTGELWCHRSIAAQWLEDNLGIEVPELDFPNLDRFAKLRNLGIPAPDYRASADLLKSIA